jgi:beta-aspartyl-dipeptidase (metallo-type)
MFTLLQNTNLYAPKKLGKKDILISGKKIVLIADNLDRYKTFDNITIIDAKRKITTPGLIDQHIHIAGAGGKQGFSGMTPDITLSELIACGTTTVNGLMGTDGKGRGIKSVYAKVKALEEEGISATMFTGYYGLDSTTITDSVQNDMIFIDKVIGCKIAISDVRSSYPTALELVRKLKDVKVGGFLSQKKGVLHVHLGNLKTKMDVLFELVNKYEFPIEHISPTHVGRTKELFDQAIEFAKLGGMIDITTAASQYTAPYKSVLYALEQGVSMDLMTFSTDGHAGLTKFDENKKPIGVRPASIDENLKEIVLLVQKGGIAIEEAFKLVTTNPAKNLGLKDKGSIEVGKDADFCLFDDNLKLTDVFANGKQMMKDTEIIVKGTFES